MTAGFRALAAATAALAWLAWAAVARAVELPAHYAESVAVYGLTADGSGEIRFRRARFPQQGTATLWMSMMAGGEHYAVVDAGLALGESAAATPVDADTASFAVAADEAITVTSNGRQGPAMQGRVAAQALAHRTHHPPEGRGTVPVRVTVAFRAWHSAVAARPGRREVFGDVSARLSTPDGEFTVEGPGKWHEQTGPRPGFAPAFTYLWGARRGAGAETGGWVGVLARGGTGDDWGFLVEGDRVTRVSRLVIDPLGPGSRRFEVGLVDGRTLSGTAQVLRESSVPIEGGRRPSSTVRIDSEGGTMVGHLNDWNPRHRARP